MSRFIIAVGTLKEQYGHTEYWLPGRTTPYSIISMLFTDRAFEDG